jgi:hypothetical protein
LVGDLGFFDGNQVDQINQLFYKIFQLKKIFFFMLLEESGNKASHDG